MLKSADRQTKDMAQRVNSTTPGEAKNDPMTIVITTGSTHSAGSRKIARAHAAAWSRKKQREEKLKVPGPAARVSPLATSSTNLIPLAE